MDQTFYPLSYTRPFNHFIFHYCKYVKLIHSTGRNIFRVLFRSPVPEKNELFSTGRMAYCVELEDEYADTDIPTTNIRSKADVQSNEVRRTRVKTSWMYKKYVLVY